MKQEKAIVLYSRAAINPETINTETREVEVIFTTETPVERTGWNELYHEILMCNETAVRKDYINNGLPLLDCHSCMSVFNQLGRAVKIWINEKRELCAVVRFSKRQTVAEIFNDVTEGLINTVSVGYKVYKYEREERGKELPPVYRALDWLPFEISLAPVPADVNTGIRTADNKNHFSIITNKINRSMEEIVNYTVGSEPVSEGDTVTLDDGRKGIAQQSGEPGDVIEVKITGETEGNGGGSSEGTEARKAAGKPNTRTFIEQNNGNDRLNAILVSTRAAKLSDTYAIELYQSCKTVEECRQAVINKLAENDKGVNGTHSMRVGVEAIEKKRTAVQSALLNRVNPKLFKLDSAAGEFRSMTLLELGKVLLHERGINLTGKDKTQIAQLLFTRAHSSTDFPLLFEGAIDKLLRAEWEHAPEFWDMIARQTTNSDFREKGLYKIAGMGGMKEIAEGGEIKYTTLIESKERIRLKSFGEGIKVTRQAIINDDLSALEIIPRKFRRDWETLRGNMVWGLLTDNIKLGDGKPIFCAEHKNLLTGATSALSEQSLETANIALQRQKDIDGKDIRVLPKFLIVAPENEVTARKLITATTPNKTEDVNVFANRFQIIVENRLTAKEWYLSADPNAVDTLYYSYLEGNESLRVHNEESFKTDCFDFAIRGDFGAAAVDFRGMVKAEGN